MFEVHEYANVFPMMNDAEYTDLKADIAAHGQREECWLYGDKLIDGRNRDKACCELGIRTRTRQWDGDESDLLAFIVSLNLKRRHLDEHQRTIVAAKIATLNKGRPKKTNEASVSSEYSSSSEFNASKEAFSESEKNGKSQADAAEMMQVSRSAVQRATKVYKDGDPALVAAMESGNVSITAAADLAKAPKETQRKAAKAGKKKAAKIAKTVREEDATKPVASPEKDVIGCQIEDPIIAAAFAERAVFQSLDHRINAMQGEFEALADGPAGVYASRNRQQFRAGVKNLHEVMRFSIPHAVCPYCGGRKCDACKQSGWMTEDLYKAVPRDVREDAKGGK